MFRTVLRCRFIEGLIICKKDDFNLIDLHCMSVTHRNLYDNFF